jgi:metal-responsive CopG/Arc/MetJ family transcriptional regulator
LVGLRLEPALLARVDRWAASQKDAPSRAQAIRRLVELGLVRTHRASKAAEMAGQEIDRLADPSASDEERQVRKRRLIKGPNEFRDLRRNRRTNE